MFEPVSKYIRSFLLLAFVCGCQYAFAQNVLADIKTQFNSYNTERLQEKLFVHTDKTVYTIGEILWFKIYEVDGFLNTPLSLSKIAYVEIISNESKPVLQAKIALDSGNGNGSFLLPASLKTGNYMLRAYTNWMKNFYPAFYFETPVTILNVDKKPDQQATKQHQVFVDFFPEGGNLVAGINSKLAFKITDETGHGLEGKGKITDQQNRTVASFSSFKFGMGNVNFTPVDGNAYKAIVETVNGAKEVQLPAFSKNGFAMELSENGDQLSVRVKTNSKAENNIYLVAQTRQLLKISLEQTLANGEAVFSFKKAELNDGISQITIFNHKKQAVCERLYFKSPKDILQLNVQSSSTFNTRKQVDIKVDANTQQSADLSVSVFLIDSLQAQPENNILSYLWLSSDLKGYIESPEFYFENTTFSAQAADNLMLTQGWRRFNWNDITENKKPQINFLPELEGHIINGQLSTKNNSQKKGNITAYLSVPGEDFKFVNTISSADGKLIFNVPPFHGRQQVVVQTNNLSDSNYRVDIADAFSTSYSERIIPAFNTSSVNKKELLVRTIGSQAQHSFYPARSRSFLPPDDNDSLLFYGRADKTYITDDYTRFPTMEEVMREYVKEVRVKKNNNHFYYEVFNSPHITHFTENPFVFIDGVPVFNIDKIIEMDPLKIKKIDVVSRAHYLSTVPMNGIVNYSTYNGDLDGFQMDPNALVIDYDGLQLQREFYSPQYKNSNDTRTPDFRNVLYWDPSLKLLKQQQHFSFYTSDVPGRYMVVVQGISADGKAGTGTTVFNVVK
jgi:hypothetical protein